MPNKNYFKYILVKKIQKTKTICRYYIIIYLFCVRNLYELEICNLNTM